MKNFRTLTCCPRGVGVTSALADAVKKFKDGHLVCFCESEARRIAKEHGIKTVSVQDPDRFRGLGGVKLWEPMAIDYVMSHYEKQIEELRNKLSELELKLEL